jgi:hypothetical protein
MKDRRTDYHVCDFDYTIISGRVEWARRDKHCDGVDVDIVIVPGNAASDGWDITKIGADICGDGRNRAPEAIQRRNRIQLQILQDEKVEF